MAVTKEFMDAVQEGKIMRVRIMLKDSLLVDPTGSQFHEMEHYAIGQLDNLYVEHDGEVLNYDVTAWGENYLNEQMVVVVNNFSEERVGLLKSMVRYLYKDKASEIGKERETSTINMNRKQVGIGVTAAGAGLAVAGLCASHSVLVVGGIAVAVVGVALIVSNEGDT